MSRTKQRGFTLIEVLVAFTILALALTVLMRIFSGGLRNVALAEDYAQAVLVAEAQLAKVGVAAPLESGETAGDWDERFRWRRLIDPYHPWQAGENSQVPVTAYWVTVYVDWEHAGRSHQFSLSSLRLQQAGEQS
jgi:general secretion pathway protein I